MPLLHWPQAAVDMMRKVLNSVNMDGVVVIGEGEKDEASARCVRCMPARRTRDFACGFVSMHATIPIRKASALRV
jgi:hypothetical protein